MDRLYANTAGNSPPSKLRTLRILRPTGASLKSLQAISQVLQLMHLVASTKNPICARAGVISLSLLHFHQKRILPIAVSQRRGLLAGQHVDASPPADAVLAGRVPRALRNGHHARANAPGDRKS